MEETRGWVHVCPSGTCHREEFVGDLQRGRSNTSERHEGGNEAAMRGPARTNARFAPSFPSNTALPSPPPRASPPYSPYRLSQSPAAHSPSEACTLRQMVFITLYPTIHHSPRQITPDRAMSPLTLISHIRSLSSTAVYSERSTSSARRSSSSRKQKNWYSTCRQRPCQHMSPSTRPKVRTESLQRGPGKRSTRSLIHPVQPKRLISRVSEPYAEPRTGNPRRVRRQMFDIQRRREDRQHIRRIA